MDPAVTAHLGPAPEQRLALDLVRKAAIIAPVAIVIAAVIGGSYGALSAAIGIALVMANFWASSAAIAWFARLGLAAMAGAAMFGYALRLAVLFVAIMLLSRASWIDVGILVFVVAFAHLGLLVWEARTLSLRAATTGSPTAKE